MARPKSEKIDKDVVQVVDRTALIENVANQVILEYCGPRKESVHFMWTVVLDGSVMSLGAKVKVISAIAHELDVKFKKDALHRVLELRNAFAHHASEAHPILHVGKEPSYDFVSHQLWILNGSGKLVRKSRKDALDEFNESYEGAKKALVALLLKIRSKGAAE